jgi:hypothetical protein
VVGSCEMRVSFGRLGAVAGEVRVPKLVPANFGAQATKILYLYFTKASSEHHV